MIIKISEQYAQSCNAQQLSDIASAAIAHKHHIKCGARAFSLINAAISANGSTTQRQLLMSYRGFQPTAQQEKHMSTMDLDNVHDSAEAIISMLEAPSDFYTENGIYEWDFYSTLPETYKTDRKYKNIFKLVSDAMKNGRIRPVHCGGYTLMPELVSQKSEEFPDNTYKYKCILVFDRDTDNDMSFSTNQNSLFQFLCGKNASDVTDNDVYSLSQPSFVWHCWYKREIENYFPDRLYSSMGVNTSAIPADATLRDYFKISNQCQGYHKSMIKTFAKSMGRSVYETNLKTFPLEDGESVSEFQLLLLKMAKII